MNDLQFDFPMTKERQDIYCMRSIYDISSSSWCKYFNNKNVKDFDKSVKCRQTILNLRFNEHDCFHRASCFKKVVNAVFFFQ